MKKYLCLGLVLLAMSCSSDDDNNPTQDLYQFQVDFKRDADYLDHETSKFNPLGFNKSTISPNPEPDSHFGLFGVLVYKIDNGYKAFDKACPVEWVQKEEKERGLLTNFRSEYIHCTKCNSEFDIITMKAISGIAKEKGLGLVQYKIELDEESGYYHITNPNYKE